MQFSPQAPQNTPPLNFQDCRLNISYSSSRRRWPNILYDFHNRAHESLMSVRTYIAYSGFSLCRLFEPFIAWKWTTLQWIRRAARSWKWRTFTMQTQFGCRNTNRRYTVNSITINARKIQNERLQSRWSCTVKLDKISTPNLLSTKNLNLTGQRSRLIKCSC